MEKSKGEKVKLEKVERRTLQEMVSASGKIFPEVEVNISSDVSGEIVELYVEEGDSVQAGQLLARVDPDAYQSAVERGRASVNNSKAQFANAQAGVERGKAQYMQAKAQKEQIEAQLENTQTIYNRNKKLADDHALYRADTTQANTGEDFRQGRPDIYLGKGLPEIGLKRFGHFHQ